MKMKILLTGKNGQVGADLTQLLPRLGEVIAFDSQQLNLTKLEEVRRAIRRIQPQIIVNAAAYTAVDQAEKEEALAHAINAEAPGVMAEEAKKIGALLIHFSTDYVFDGAKTTPYTEEDFFFSTLAARRRAFHRLAGTTRRRGNHPPARSIPCAP